MMIMFGLDAFKQSPLGKQVGRIITDRDNIIRMTALSESKIPAVQAIGKRLLPLGDQVASDTNKKTIGRWVREVLEAEGWTPVRKGRVAPGNLFSTGAIYAPKR
jgi:hypothetical protein